MKDFNGYVCFFMFQNSDFFQNMARYLIAFDFDHTLIDENSDLYVIKLAPNKDLPDEIKDLHEDHGWINYMSQIFKYAFTNDLVLIV